MEIIDGGRSCALMNAMVYCCLIDHGLNSFLLNNVLVRMMRFYSMISIFGALLFLGVSIFYFLNDDSFHGRLFVLVTVIAFFGLYYFFKMVYYLRYQATFNELSFVVFFPFVPLIQSVFKVIVIDSVLPGYVFVLQGEESVLFRVDFIDFLGVPYYFFALFLVLRTHLRYPFIRPQGHSTDGFNPRFMAFLLLVTLPPLYFVFGFTLGNALLVFFAIVFGVVCFLGFFV